MNSKELQKLILDYGDASFQCGEYYLAVSQMRAIGCSCRPCASAGATGTVANIEEGSTMTTETAGEREALIDELRAVAATLHSAPMLTDDLVALLARASDALASVEATPAARAHQPPEPAVPSAGVTLIWRERQRQIEQEGWDAAHDAEHKPGELATAGYHYAANAAACLGVLPGSLHIWDNWPWHPDWWKPTTPMRDLVKAGALIAAEIDRMSPDAMPAPLAAPTNTEGPTP